jgi:hypothetical protein
MILSPKIEKGDKTPAGEFCPLVGGCAIYMVGVVATESRGRLFHINYNPASKIPNTHRIVYY